MNLIHLFQRRRSIYYKKLTKYLKYVLNDHFVLALLLLGGAATSNYGVVGMASKNAIRDGFDGILNRANYKRGVVVKSEDNEITVDVYIIVGYGLKISEVSKNVQDSVKFNLSNQLGINTKAVNVIVQSVKILDE